MQVLRNFEDKKIEYIVNFKKVDRVIKDKPYLQEVRHYVIYLKWQQLGQSVCEKSNFKVEMAFKCSNGVKVVAAT